MNRNRAFTVGTEFDLAGTQIRLHTLAHGIEQGSPQQGPDPVPKIQTVKIDNIFDMVTARQAARRFAQRAGFVMADQVGISLATWSLAKALELGRFHQGQVTIDCLSNGSRQGIRVVCTRQGTTPHAVSPETFDGIKWMVDELTVETQPSNDIQVTIIKWADRQRNI